MLTACTVFFGRMHHGAANVGFGVFGEDCFFARLEVDRS